MPFVQMNERALGALLESKAFRDRIVYMNAFTMTTGFEAGLGVYKAGTQMRCSEPLLPKKSLVDEAQRLRKLGRVTKFETTIMLDQLFYKSDRRTVRPDVAMLLHTHPIAPNANKRQAEHATFPSRDDIKAFSIFANYLPELVEGVLSTSKQTGTTLTLYRGKNVQEFSPMKLLRSNFDDHAGNKLVAMQRAGIACVQLHLNHLNGQVTRGLGALYQLFDS